MCRQFRVVCKLILQRLREIPKRHYFHIWHKVTLELFKVPRILIVSLKRFRKSSRQIWGGSKKIDTHV